MKNAIVRLGFCLLFLCGVTEVFAGTPTPTISRVSPERTNLNTMTFSVTFTEAVAGFTDSDIDIDGSANAGATAVIAPSGTNTWTITISNITNDGTIQVSIDPTMVTSVADGTANPASNDVTNVRDTDKPDVTTNKRTNAGRGVQADPSDADNTIWFTVVFDEPMNTSTVEMADFNTTGSTATGLSITSLNMISSTEFDVEVTVSGANGDVKLALAMNMAEDEAGNLNNVSTVASDNTVTYRTAPTIDPVTVDNIDFPTGTNSQADFHGNIVSNGGESVDDRGFIWRTTPGIDWGEGGNQVVTSGSGNGAFNETNVDINAAAGQLIYLVAYAENGVGRTLSPEISFYSISLAPTAAAAGVSIDNETSNSLRINYGAFGTNVQGFVIVRTPNTAIPNAFLVDGKAPHAANHSAPAPDVLTYTGVTFIADITANGPGFVTDAGLTQGTTYRYAVIPYNKTSSTYKTINYRATITETVGTTLAGNSTIDEDGGGTATIDYEDFQSPLPFVVANAKEIADFRLRDGGGSNDNDGKATDLKTITLTIGHVEHLRTIAIVVNGTDIVGAQNTTDGDNTYDFTIPDASPGVSLISAAQNSDKHFQVMATFDAPVVENDIITVTVTAATVASTKSQLSGTPFTTAFTPNTVNKLNVVADLIVVTSRTPAGVLLPNTRFNVTVEARDDLGSVDRSNTTNLIVADKTSPPPSPIFISVDGGAGNFTKALNNGSATFNNLYYPFAGAGVFTIDYQGGSGPATIEHAVSVESVGVTINPKANLADLCFNSPNQTPATTFVSLPAITITEEDPSDFTPGNVLTFSLKLPVGFIFDTLSVRTPLSIGGANIQQAIDPGTGNPYLPQFVSNDIVRYRFTVVGITGLKDYFTMTGLRVKYAGTTVVTNQNILRVGGTAVIKGDSETDAKSHGTLSSAAPTLLVDFRNTNGGSIHPDETRFSSISSPPIILEAFTLPATPTSTVTTGVQFSGNGILFGADGKFRFYPTAVAIGTHQITLTYTNPASPNCRSIAVKNFEVFPSLINGLATEYCDSDPAATMGSIPNFPTDICGVVPRFTFTRFVWYNWNANAAGPAGWNGFSPANQFDPKIPAFQQVYNDTRNFWGEYGIIIGYEVQEAALCGGFVYVWQYDVVKIKNKPPIAMTAPPAFFCSSDPLYTLTGSPLPKGGSSFDKFWASEVGNPNDEINNAVIGSSSSQFQLDPEEALEGAPDFKNIQVNYQWEQVPGSGCSNTVSRLVTIFKKPTVVPNSNITARLAAGNLNPEFCETEIVTPFTANTLPGVIYNWYGSDPSEDPIAPEGNSFNPVTALIDANGNDIPDIATTTFHVTRTTNRQAPTPTLPAGFFGCESDPIQLTVRIDDAPVAFAGVPNVKVCNEEDLELILLGATVTPGIGHPALAATWSTTTGGVFVNAAKDEANPINTLGPARWYLPSGADVTAGGFRLTLTTDDPDGACGIQTSSVDVAVNSSITVTAPADLEVCAGTTFDLEATLSDPTSNLGITWTENGLEAIPPGKERLLSTQYTPHATENTFGAIVSFTVTTDDPDGAGPCGVDSDVVLVTISRKAAVAAGADLIKCADETIQMSGTIPAQSTAASFTWTTTGGGTFSNNTAGNTTYTPTTAEKGLENTLTFTLTSNDPAGNCPAEVDEMTVKLNPRPAKPASIIGDADPNNAKVLYCVGQDIEKLTAGGQDLRWYENAALTSQQGAGSEFTSGVPNNVDGEKTFWVTQTGSKSLSFPAGCQSDALAITIVVNPLPVPKFSVQNFCFGDKMVFVDESTVKPSTAGTRTITDWSWDFDDDKSTIPFGSGSIPANTHGGATSGTYTNIEHVFERIGEYNVRLQARTSDGCVRTVFANELTAFTPNSIRVGAVPKAEFSWTKICKDDQTAFVRTNAEVGETETYAWDFGDPGSTGNTATIATPSHKFTDVNTYDVQLRVTTGLGCQNTITKKVNVLPFIKTFPYIQSFENNTHGWFPSGSYVVESNPNPVLNHSWMLSDGSGLAAIDPNPNAGSRFWVTNDPSIHTYHNNERSVLNGPCVDMTALQRAVVAMDYWSDTDGKSDGAYVEVWDEEASPNAEKWVRLGDTNSGLNWYDESSVAGLALNSSGIGQDISQLGWSGRSTLWKTGRFNLDNYANRKRLRFRVVFGSNSSQPLEGTFDGFALDYFKLETRNRLVLVENFTNETTAARDNNTAFKAFPSVAASSEVVKIEYHTGVTGETPGPIYSQNQMDPNGRASFYGLSAVPRGYVDGYTAQSGTGAFTIASNWAHTYYNTESLVTSPIDIVINQPTITNGVLNITGVVTAREFALKANSYSLYIAVVEETVAGADFTNEYVLRKMLPSASGLKIPVTALGGTFAFNQSWNVDRAYLSSAAAPKLVAIAFVQSDIIVSDPLPKRQVLQAAINRNFPTLNFTTGLELPILEQTALYPNPADRILHIALPQPTKNGVEVKVLDQLGRAVIQSAIKPGESSTSVDTGDLADTIYLVQLKENGVYTTRRLLVTHKR